MIGDLPEVFASAGAAVGFAGENTLDFPQARKAVVMVVDGLGYGLLADHYDIAPYLASLLQGPPHWCGVPSTTATSLTSLSTGLPPGQHGVVGYTSRIPSSGQRINSLKWDDNVDPVHWQPHDTILQRLQAAGLAVAVINDAQFAGSGLTLCGQRGVPYVPIETPWERHEAVLQFAEAPGSGVAYAYESRLDHAGHKTGVDSEPWREVLSTIDGEIKLLREHLPSDVVLIVTADHGMIDLPHEDRFDMDDIPALHAHVTLVAGEARLRHIYTEPGANEVVAEIWRRELGERADVLTRQEAEAANWFGTVSELVRPRIGDVVVAARGDFAVFSKTEFPIERLMTGFHGSLSDAERQIPMLIDR